MFTTTTILLTATVPMVAATGLVARQSCGADFEICAPSGATTNSLGQISSAWAGLFDSIVHLVNDFSLNAPTTSPVDPDGPARRDLDSFCCLKEATCLLNEEYGIPMCWDKFTTNVDFPDGTFGEVVSGDFNTSAGDVINLVYGDYTRKDGTTGNIYNGDAVSSMMPDTMTLPMPSQWTSSGVGSAIPGPELGTMASMSIGTTVVPATTEPPSTADSITIIATMTGCGHCPAHNTTVPGPTQPGSTRAASTSVFTTGIITPPIQESIASKLSLNTVTALIFYIAAWATMNL